ncbi:MAG: GNAT family N-acetyltransferase [Myxococcota bacterium]
MSRIRLARPEDDRTRRALLEVLARAFRDNPMNRTIHGRHPGRRVRANRAGLRSLVLDLHPWTVTRVIRNEGQVVGGFVAVPPGGLPLPGASLRRQLACLLWQGARAMDRWGFVTETLARAHPLEPHWYLAVLGVDPAWQGHGFGSRLVDGLADLVRDEPRPVYLESDRPESVAFYCARGFERLGDVWIFDVQCWRLGRDPHDRSSGEGSDLCHPVFRPDSDPPPGSVPRRKDRSEAAT